MLHLDGVSKSFAGPQGAVRALDGVSLQVNAGECVAIQGPSGSGKSTLLLIAGALLRPDSGAARLEEQDLYALSREARARTRAERIGFVFQQFHLIPYLTVLENVLAPSVAFRRDGAEDRAEELLARFALTSRRDHVPAQLSTGERQRTALARALLNRPRLVLADEPTGNLDEENARIVLGFLADYTREGGAVLLVTHDARACAAAQRVLRLESGRLAG